MQKTKERLKAEELVNKFLDEIYYLSSNERNDVLSSAKHCAIICVDMAIDQFIGVYDSLKFADQLTGNVEDSANYKFWQEVKRILIEEI
ncbi:MAG: hypothetical protein ACP5N7_01335 [Candidatus Pacearchaeota archaeon]